MPTSGTSGFVSETRPGIKKHKQRNTNKDTQTKKHKQTKRKGDFFLFVCFLPQAATSLFFHTIFSSSFSPFHASEQRFEKAEKTNSSFSSSPLRTSLQKRR